MARSCQVKSNPSNLTTKFQGVPRDPEAPRSVVRVFFVSGELRVPVKDLGRHGRIWLLSVEGRDAVLAAAEMTCHGSGCPILSRSALRSFLRDACGCR